MQLTDGPVSGKSHSGTPAFVTLISGGILALVPLLVEARRTLLMGVTLNLNK
jgi:hypothetical protein